MTLPADLSAKSESLLKELSLNLTKSQDNGMHKVYIWTNEVMHFCLGYDRGFYDCDIEPFQKPINYLSLIRLLRFLKNDKTFYRNELIEANMWYTLTTNQYVELFYKNYNLIEDFLIAYDQKKYDDYNHFEFAYDGIQFK